MKIRTTFAAAAVAVVSSALFAQDSVTNSVTTVVEPIVIKYLDLTSCSNVYIPRHVSVDAVVKQLREQGDMTNLIKKLVESGDVCTVVVHKWDIRPRVTDIFTHVTLGYRPDGDYPEHRICSLCGKVETKEPGVWK
jgi:hypothetical protein